MLNFRSFKLGTICTILILVQSVNCFSQSEFDSKLQALSDTIAFKINAIGKKKVAVWDFTDPDGQVTRLGKYISEEMSVNLTNSAKSFNVMDRNHLSTILREHKLNAEGFIDANTAKELGRMQAVDAIVTGTITILEDRIKISVKVLDTETALIVAASKGDLPIKEVASFIGISDGNSSGTTNRGFNRPLNSNEQYNNSETVNNSCKENNTGDYCFTNSTNYKLVITVVNRAKFSLEPSQSQCLYNINAGPIQYNFKEDYQLYNRTRNTHAQKTGSGEVLIEQCKSKTFIIN